VPAVRLRVLTWNLKGGDGLDVAAVVDHIRAVGADVVALQEVQWHQARAIARGLGARSRRWAFKHWPVRTWPEGLAVVGVTVSVSGRGRALSHRWQLWSWRRRIAVIGRLDGTDVAFLDLHLSPHSADELREAEVAVVLAALADHDGPAIVAGDLNDRPDGPIHRRLAAAGLRDAWLAQPHDDGDDDVDGGATNWQGWRPGTTKRPSRRIDYVYVSDGIEVVDADVPTSGGDDDDGLAPFAALSDHLPLSAELAWGSVSGQPISSQG